MIRRVIGCMRHTCRTAAAMSTCWITRWREVGRLSMAHPRGLAAARKVVLPRMTRIHADVLRNRRRAAGNGDTAADTIGIRVNPHHPQPRCLSLGNRPHGGQGSVTFPGTPGVRSRTMSRAIRPKCASTRSPIASSSTGISPHRVAMCVPSAKQAVMSTIDSYRGDNAPLPVPSSQTPFHRSFRE